MPIRQYGLCALALLPTIAFTRSTLDADQVTNGLSFLFIASIMSVAAKAERISLPSIVFLAVIAFLTAQCKSAYLVLLALAFAIPVARYGSARRWLLASLAITIPSFVASLAWMIALKHSYFAGIHYYVLSSLVYPDQQVAAILADPLGFAAVLARSLFLSPLLPMTFLGLLGIFGPPVWMPIIAYLLVFGALFSALIAEGAPHRPDPSRLSRWLAVGVFFAGFGLILTLIYIQWDGVGAPVISGFNGRYLYPLLPPLLLFLPSKKSAMFGLDAPAWVAILGLIATSSTLGVTWTTYWA
jgi:uncharacterized membrane protein